jgi:hypothetical protein
MRDAVWTVEVNSVWSFDRPSRLTGSFLACHSIRFSRFKLRRINPLPCGFTRRTPLIRSRRRGDTLRIPLCRVNRFLEHFREVSRAVRPPVAGIKRASRESLSGGIEKTILSATLSWSSSSMWRLPAAVGFQSLPGLLRDCPRREGVLYTHRTHCAIESAKQFGNLLYPPWLPPTRVPRRSRRTKCAATG